MFPLATATNLGTHGSSNISIRTSMKSTLLRFSLLLLAAVSAFGQERALVVQGSAVVGQVFKVAEPFLKSELGIEIRLNTEGGSSAGLGAVGGDVAQLGLMSRKLDAGDRALFPASAFDDVQIGWQVLVMGVAHNVWESGIHALSSKQMQGIYEGEIRNWKQIGGPDEAIKFYNPKQGRGVWELFAEWLYKRQGAAPKGEKFETVVRYEDARDAVEFNASSITVLPPNYADGKGVHALAIKEPDGSLLEPTNETLAAGKYPMAKPLVVISGRRFAGDARKVVDFLLTPRGQAMVKSQGLVPIREAADSYKLPDVAKPKETAASEPAK
jgi:phosphate transport system substrate-binding protein